jgi:hypothetical protein
MATRYDPNPIDTSKIALPAGVISLTERLAENAHDVWALQRISEGWQYGTERNDKDKRHPCLIPYSELPESEKEYDRKTAMDTLKAILAMGYKIDKC